MFYECQLLKLKIVFRKHQKRFFLGISVSFFDICLLGHTGCVVLKVFLTYRLCRFRLFICYEFSYVYVKSLFLYIFLASFLTPAGCDMPVVSYRLCHWEYKFRVFSYVYVKSDFFNFFLAIFLTPAGCAYRLCHFGVNAQSSRSLCVVCAQVLGRLCVVFAQALGRLCVVCAQAVRSLFVVGSYLRNASNWANERTAAASEPVQHQVVAGPLFFGLSEEVENKKIRVGPNLTRV